MSYGTLGTTHDLQVDKFSASGNGPWNLEPINLTNAIDGYTYNRNDKIMITVADVSPGWGEFNSSDRSLDLGTYSQRCCWGARCGKAVSRPFLTGDISDAGDITFTMSMITGCHSRGKTPRSKPAPGLVSISVIPAMRSEGLPSGNLTWHYGGQPDLNTRNITTGQPPDLVAIELNVIREDIQKWSYELAQQGYDLTTKKYGGEFDVNRGTTTKVYQVHEGAEALVLRGKDNVGNVLITTNGTITT